MKNMKTFSVLALSSVYAVGNIFPGECPEIPNQPDFDAEAYMGVWFTYLANDWKNVPENADCVAATYDLISDSVIGVNNTSVFNVEGRTQDLQILSWAKGTAEVMDASEPTELYVSFNQFGGCGHYGWICGDTRPDKNLIPDPFPAPEGPHVNYQVADTDYENYTVIISCYAWNDSPVEHSQISYILVRDREWPAKNQEKVQELLYNLESWGLDINSLRETRQDNCDQWEGRIP